MDGLIHIVDDFDDFISGGEIISIFVLGDVVEFVEFLPDVLDGFFDGFDVGKGELGIECFVSD